VLSTHLKLNNSTIQIRRLLIANRGEIACRIIHTAQAMGIQSIAVFSEADRDARHVQMAHESLCIGPAPASESYLNIAAIIAACKQSQADAVHPGYGFLSENADFAQACLDAGICFVGPTPSAMRALGNKAAAKEIAQRAGVAVARGYTGSVNDLTTVIQEAEKIGYPLMVKAAAGGGGRGMRLVQKAHELPAAIVSAQRESKSSFGSDQVFLERAILNVRHIEIQILADQHGNVFSLGERDCSTQRKNQKIIEEAPAPGLSANTRQALSNAAIQLCKATNYYGAGTVEFLVEQLDSNSVFYFLEVNTRLQVEHPVTEALLGINLVEQQLRIAQGEVLKLNQQGFNAQMAEAGHAIELRLCAEDPMQEFAPQVGPYQQSNLDIAGFNSTQFAPHTSAKSYLRIDSGLNSSGAISPWYDSMCAKLISYAPTREQAIKQMLTALDSFTLSGLQSNQTYLATLLKSAEFRDAQLHTRWLGSFNLGLLSTPAGGDAGGDSGSNSGSYSSSDSGSKSNNELSNKSSNELTSSLSSAQSTLLLQAAAVFAQNQSAPHGLLQGFGGLTTTLQIELNGTVHSIQTRCLGNNEFECGPQVSTESQSTGNHNTKGQIIDVRKLKPVWFDKQVWLPNYQALNRGQLQPVGGLFKLLPYKSKNSSSSQQAAGDVFSSMHGKVNQVLVAIGSTVTKGDVLLTIEAMKMEHQIVAKVDGVIHQIAVAVDQQVSPMQLLVTLSSAQTNAPTNAPPNAPINAPPNSQLNAHTSTATTVQKPAT
jgi:geranyl-CoA carboxylase alpha subunit